MHVLQWAGVSSSVHPPFPGSALDRYPVLTDHGKNLDTFDCSKLIFQ